MRSFGDLIRDLLDKIKEGIEKLKKQLEDEANERYKRKYGLVFQAIEDKMKDVEETLDTMNSQQKLSNERAAAICNVLSSLSDRLQDLSPENIEQTTGDILNEIDNLQKKMGETIIIKVDTFREMLDKTIPPEEQNMFDVRLTEDNKPVIYSQDKAYSIERTGNAFMLKQMTQEERDAISWVATLSVNGATLAERAKTAFETAYNRGRGNVQRQIDNLQALAMFEKLKDGDIASNQMTIHYDAEKQTVFFRNNDNDSMIAVMANKESMTAYYYDKSDKNFASNETGIPVFNVTRSPLADGTLQSTGTSFDLKANGVTQNMAQNITDILSDKHMTALTELYHLDDMNDLKQILFIRTQMKM